jgi:hypothetical protein
MAHSTLPVLTPPDFHNAAPPLIAFIARAIVHLNFNEPDQARDVLLDALTDFNFPQAKENADGNRTAAA